MTRKEINICINKVPNIVKRNYGLCELRELTNEPYRLVQYGEKSYRYYHNIPGILVGSKLIVWDKGSDMCNVDPTDPGHFEEILRRGYRNQYENIVGIATKEISGKIHIELENPESIDTYYDKMFPIDGTVIYYKSQEINLERHKNNKTKIIALFLAKRYAEEHIIPFKGADPIEWGDYAQ